MTTVKVTNDDRFKYIDENSSRVLPEITEYYEDLCRLIGGDTNSVPSWLTREKCIVSTCDDLIRFFRHIQKQYKE
jgi:hypothetical protein